MWSPGRATFSSILPECTSLLGVESRPEPKLFFSKFILCSVRILSGLLWEIMHVLCGNTKEAKRDSGSSGGWQGRQDPARSDVPVPPWPPQELSLSSAAPGLRDASSLHTAHFLLSPDVGPKLCFLFLAPSLPYIILRGLQRSYTEYISSD